MQNFHQHNKIFAGNLYPAQKCGKIRLTKSKPVLFFYFEKENIYTLDAKGELLITIMSSLAQEEVESLSSNVKMGLQMKW